MSARDFLLPDLGEGLEDAEIVQWRVAEGDRVELNQPLVEVNTAKALVEIPSPWAGVVETLHAAEGGVVAVGHPLVTIRVEEGGDAGGGVSETPAGRPKRRAVLVGYGVEDENPATEPGRPGAGEHAPARVAATPPVRRLARDLGVDLRTVLGTGPEGRVTREDVLGMVPAGGTHEGPEAPERSEVTEVAERIPIRGVRRLIAERMTRAVREIPHVTTFLTLDASWLQAYRSDVLAASGASVGPLPVVVRALAEVCREHPLLNASFDGERGEIVVYREVHVGVATDTERGLLVPVIRSAGEKGIGELSREIAALAGAAREGTITPDAMAGGTITVTNVGTFGAEFGTPIINFPQGAILALGVIEPRALVVDGEVAARPACTLSLSFDHRLMDGAQAGRALAALRDLLQSPSGLRALPG